jgi:hypothetical protein
MSALPRPRSRAAGPAAWHDDFARDGFVVVPGLLSPAEVAELRDHFMALHAAGPIPGCFHPVPLTEAGGDILKAYPRMMHPHRISATAKRHMLHPAVLGVLEALLGEPVLAAQSMLYFKPPSARGQALHQDDYYLKTSPGRCVAAWVALDPSDEGNGGMMVVPGTQDQPVLCPHEADPERSFTRDEVDIPPGLEPVTVPLAAGDVLFFHGTLVHGSYPNTSRDRFRRAFICHYVAASTARISDWYNPLVAPDGREVRLPANPWGGPCGEEHEL